MITAMAVRDPADLRLGDLVCDDTGRFTGTIAVPPQVAKGHEPDAADPAWDCVVLWDDGEAWLHRAYKLRLLQRMGVN